MNSGIYLYISIVLFVFIIQCDAQEVEIPQGVLKGDLRTNRDGGTYYSFKSIPYAKPPLGALRFKPPEEADGWEGVRDATVELPQCTQFMSVFGYPNGRGQEDCLYLNIYTPGVPAENVTQKAVMVFLYGGSFSGGDAREYSYGADFFLTKDIVLVVINYRLGVFGFLSLDDPDLGITGNAGIKDHVMAFKWIKNNIEYFGGDPNNVVIFGESAGGISVNHHMLSPMSRGLFNKAISESGVSLNPTTLSGSRNSALIFAEYFGIQTENYEDMLAALQEIPTDELYDANTALESSYSGLTSPIIEISANTPTFLEKRPIDIIDSGDIYHVPYMVGFNSAEGLIRLQGLNDSSSSGGEDSQEPNFAGYIPADLQIESGSEAEEDIIQRFKDFYYSNVATSADDVMAGITLFTDYICTYPVYRTATKQLETTSYPIYFYYLSADTQMNFKSVNPGMTPYPGASHFDELGYLFTVPWTPTEIAAGSPEDLVSRAMVDLWTNFAIYGNSTPDGSDYVWEPFQKDQFNYLHIATEGVFPSSDLLPENIKLWSDIYDEYYPRAE